MRFAPKTLPASMLLLTNHRKGGGIPGPRCRKDQPRRFLHLRVWMVGLLLVLVTGTGQADENDIPFEDDMARLSERDFAPLPQMTLFGAEVYVFEPTVGETDEAYDLYPILPALLALKADAEALARDVATSAPRTLFVGAMVSGNPDLTTGAYTNCGTVEEAYAWIGYELTSSAPAGKACVIVVYVDKVESGDMLAFYLAHELFHTLQQAEHEWEREGTAWWSEGSADWFAHELVSGVTFRDRWIRRFLAEQSDRPISEFSYDAQTFFFWGARQFDARWVMEQGIDGNIWLTTPEQAAETMGPDHWLDWAAFQLDGQVLYPDGRALPVSATQEIGIPSPACGPVDPIRHEGPPLSAQLLTLRIADPAKTDTLVIDAGSAWLRIFGAGPDPLDIEGGSADLILEGEAVLKIAAIVPGGEPLDISFTPQGEADSDADAFQQACGCETEVLPASLGDSCVVGTWRLTSGGIVAWFQAISELTAAYGLQSSASGTMDDDVVYVFTGDGQYTVRSAGGVLLLQGMSMTSAGMGAIETLHSPSEGHGRYCVRDGQVFLSAADVVGISGGEIETYQPDFFGMIAPSAVSSEPTTWNYHCTGNSLNMEGSRRFPRTCPKCLPSRWD